MDQKDTMRISPVINDDLVGHVMKTMGFSIEGWRWKKGFVSSLK
jgi:hypothetical protein